MSSDSDSNASIPE